MKAFQFLAAGCLIGTTVSAPCGGLPCAADMPDVDEFHAGGMLPAMKIPCDGKDFIIDPATNNSFKGVVVMAVDENDLFTKYMTSDAGSFDKFFGISSRPSIPIILASWNNQSLVGQIRSALNQKISTLNATDRIYWTSKIMYATETLDSMTSSDPKSRDPTKASTNVPARILNSKSFISVRKHLSIAVSGGWLNVSRLDGFFQFVNTQDLHNHSPVNPINANITRGDPQVACNSKKPIKEVPGIILLLKDELSCSNEVAVQSYAAQRGVVAVVIMAKKSTPTKLSNIGEDIASNDESAFNVVGSMIEYNQQVVDLLPADKSISAVLEYTLERGQFFSVDHSFRLRQIGSPINPILAVVSWQAEYLNYLYLKKENELRMEGENALSHHTSIFEAVQGSVHTTGSVGAVSNFVIPARAGELFNRAMVSVKFECPGNGDLECPVWDRIATVKAVCDTQPNKPFELTRWISPYRRSIGQWNVDVTQYLPYFSSSKSVSCKATLTGFSFNGFSEPWLSTVSLTLYNDNSNNYGSPTDVHQLPFKGGTYDSTYNKRAQPTNITISNTATELQLTALITGHGSDNYGCCEFLPTKHVFEISGEEYSVAFLDPLDKWGCTRKASLGVEPNGFGAWWFGRNGWCNGDIVRPVSFNIPVQAGKDHVEIKYYSLIYNTTTKGWNNPPCTSGCGDIDMTSYVTEYKQ